MRWTRWVVALLLLTACGAASAPPQAAAPATEALALPTVTPALAQAEPSPVATVRATIAPPSTATSTIEPSPLVEPVGLPLVVMADAVW